MHKKSYPLPMLDPKISVCEDGCIHLQIGPATLHVSADGLRDLTALAQRYLATLEKQPADTVPRKNLH